MISENESLEKSFASNLRKIFSSWSPDLFYSLSPEFFSDLWYKFWKKLRWQTEKKFRCAGTEIFLRFEADLNFSRPSFSEIKVQIKWLNNAAKMQEIGKIFYGIFILSRRFYVIKVLCTSSKPTDLERILTSILTLSGMTFESKKNALKLQ